MFLHVTDVTYLDSYRLRLRFDDGSLKEVDLKNELYSEVFESLKDPNFFRRVQINRETNTIEWPNGADFAPEFLYKIGRDVEKASVEKIPALA